SFRSEILALTTTLARLSREEEAAAIAPLMPRRPGRLWLVRDKSLPEVDPISLAATALIDVEVRAELPTVAELAGGIGLLVLGRESAAGVSRAEIEALLRKAPTPVPALHVTTMAPTVANDRGVESI